MTLVSTKEGESTDTCVHMWSQGMWPNTWPDSEWPDCFLYDTGFDSCLVIIRNLNLVSSVQSIVNLQSNIDIETDLITTKSFDLDYIQSTEYEVDLISNRDITVNLITAAPFSTNLIQNREVLIDLSSDKTVEPDPNSVLINMQIDFKTQAIYSVDLISFTSQNINLKTVVEYDVDICGCGCS